MAFQVIATLEMSSKKFPKISLDLTLFPMGTGIRNWQYLNTERMHIFHSDDDPLDRKRLDPILNSILTLSLIFYGIESPDKRNRRASASFLTPNSEEEGEKQF